MPDLKTPASVATAAHTASKPKMDSLNAPLTHNPNREQSEGWPPLLPLSPSSTPSKDAAATIEPPPYPMDALPSLIRTAVTAYQAYGQQPLSLIANSALANVSLACQALANVARDRCLVGPVSIYFLCIASSGERKSASDETFSQGIQHWQHRIREKRTPEIVIAQTLKQAWRVEKAGLLSQLRRFSGDPSQVAYLRRELIDHLANEPDVPLLPSLFFEDTTPEALGLHLAQGWPSAALWSNEGGIVLGGHGMQNNATQLIALLNRLWEGKPVVTHRKTQDSFIIENRRLTVNLMMQPLIWAQFSQRNGGLSRHSGFLARTLMSCPATAMGERFYQEPKSALSALSPFQDRLVACLNESLRLDRRGCHPLPTLDFSRSGKRTWITFFNAIESGLEQAQQWQSIQDIASKAAENVARLAALFHLFAGKTGSIAAETVEQAVELVNWYLNESKRLLHPKPNADLAEALRPEAQIDAEKIVRWLTSREYSRITARQLLQQGPVRNKTRRDAAIEWLITAGYLRPAEKTGHPKSAGFEINPHLLTP